MDILNICFGVQLGLLFSSVSHLMIFGEGWSSVLWIGANAIFCGAMVFMQ